MSRARHRAGGLLAVILLGVCLLGVCLLGVCGTPALAAPTGAARREAPPAAAPGPRQAEIEARRRDEVDALQRQDIADALRRLYNIDIDWRTTPLDRLIDIRVRAAKAAELQERLGVSVDWQRYSWIELEALRRTLMSFERERDRRPETAAATPLPAAPQPPSAGDGLVRPTFKGRPVGRGARVTDPDGIIRPTFTGRVDLPIATRDPDGVIKPTFAARPRWSTAALDPDGLITPTFAPARRITSLGDADDLIDPTRDPAP